MTTQDYNKAAHRLKAFSKVAQYQIGITTALFDFRKAASDKKAALEFGYSYLKAQFYLNKFNNGRRLNNP